MKLRRLLFAVPLVFLFLASRADESPPFDVKDPAVTEDLRALYLNVDQMPASPNNWTATQYFAGGTASLPSIAFTNATGTGLFQSGNRLGLTANGSLELLLQGGLATFSDEVSQPGQPSFLVTDGNGAVDVTGNGTLYTELWPTEIYDQANNFSANTFTAPITGRYLLTAGVLLNHVLSTHTDNTIEIITSNRNYFGEYPVEVSMTYMYMEKSVIADMDAGDTAVVKINCTGGTKTVDIYPSDGYNTFSGSLIN